MRILLAFTIVFLVLQISADQTLSKRWWKGFSELDFALYRCPKFCNKDFPEATVLIKIYKDRGLLSKISFDDFLTGYSKHTMNSAHKEFAEKIENYRTCLEVCRGQDYF
ncbi:hypothetical protein Ciccas_004362 [Cichlidogyrus casuarinus]|uniref:Uncharacterized protein n=1 Tax=Cichlidogyrus casuarinus TaxID=1844966 RepID=A0ABD2QBU0_9PLAT